MQAQKWDQCSASLSKTTATGEQQVWLVEKRDSLSVSPFLCFSCFPPHILLHLFELLMRESIPMFFQHNEILNPVYSMSSDSIPVFILEAFPLAPADCSHLGF